MYTYISRVYKHTILKHEMHKNKSCLVLINQGKEREREKKAYFDCYFEIK